MQLNNIDMNISYCSDKYQYTMGKSFYQDGMKDTIAIFNLFFRKAPDTNNWGVVSGVREALKMIKGIGSENEQFFESFIPGDEYAEFRTYLANMKFTGEVYAMQEGEIAFPTEPVITIKAPLIEAQVLETPLLCIMNHQMAIATKASRVTRSTEKPVSEFGSRRAHGPWAATFGAKAAYIGGCVNSSNILMANMFKIPASGTMAHSYVTSFGCTIKGELSAFKSYIQTHRGEALILLIDTYDTLNCGLKNAMKAYKECGIDDSYPYGYGIRLDSGDLAYLSIKCREELDAEGFKNCKIFATNSLDEYLIPDLEKQGAKIDAYGVGDAIATSKHNPCFGNVYKLVQIGETPVLKRSEDKAKLINPGFQITYRIIRDGKFKADITCLRGDEMSKKIEACEKIVIRDEFNETMTKTFLASSYEWKVLQVPMMKGGEIIYKDLPLEEKRAYYKNNLNMFNNTETRLVNPHFYKVDISDDLYDLKMNLINNLIEEINNLKDEPTVVIIDMLNDFIEGSLACNNAENAIKNVVEFLDNNKIKEVFYVADAHPTNHCSFKENGGTWPVHCVDGSKGGEIHEAFYKLKKEWLRPSAINIFKKGYDSNNEQYSGYNALNINNIELCKRLSGKNIVVCGIATDFCVLETVKDILKNEERVSILENGLAYVTLDGHKEALEILKNKGAIIK